MTQLVERVRVAWKRWITHRRSPVSALGGQRLLPFLPLAPAIVVALAGVVAVAILFAGVHHLARVSDEHAAAEADLLSRALAARLEHLRPADRSDALALASRRSGAEFVVVSEAGDLVVDASLGAPDRAALAQVVKRGRGEALTALGRTRFSATRLAVATPTSDRRVVLYLVAFAPIPDTPEGAAALVKALVALTLLLVTAAAGTAYAVAREAHRDARFVERRIRNMMAVQSEPTGEAVPVRTLDEVGRLTASFNDLVSRFAASEKSYREDLERVKIADRDRATFLAAVSHELRSPLNAILGFADVLSQEVDGPLPEDSREEVEQIRGSGQHLLDLISDILEFSAIESGQLKLVRTRVDVQVIVQEVLREAAAMVQGRPVTLTADVERGLDLYADPKRLRQIATNLVGNAVKFTQAGEVRVTVSRTGAYGRLSVTDTGPGISDAERALIFEEYKQAGEERKKRRGSGLGLAIARRLVLMHGGTIQLESQLGKGSTFHVFLPLYFEAPGASEPVNGTVAPGAKGTTGNSPWESVP
jgi:signal transduction histidine kinase